MSVTSCLCIIYQPLGYSVLWHCAHKKKECPSRITFFFKYQNLWFLAHLCIINIGFGFFSLTPYQRVLAVHCKEAIHTALSLFSSRGIELFFFSIQVILFFATPKYWLESCRAINIQFTSHLTLGMLDSKKLLVLSSEKPFRIMSLLSETSNKSQGLTLGIQIFEIL